MFKLLDLTARGFFNQFTLSSHEFSSTPPFFPTDHVHVLLMQISKELRSTYGSNRYGEQLKMLKTTQETKQKS